MVVSHSVNRTVEAASNRRPVRTFKSRSVMATLCTMGAPIAAVTTSARFKPSKHLLRTTTRPLPPKVVPLLQTLPRHRHLTNSSLSKRNNSRRLTSLSRSERMLINLVATLILSCSLTIRSSLAEIMHSKIKHQVPKITAQRHQLPIVVI